MTPATLSTIDSRLLIEAAIATGNEPAEILAETCDTLQRAPHGWTASLDPEVAALWNELPLTARLVAVIHAAALSRYQYAE